MPQKWSTRDEWYNFKALAPDNQVVVRVDEDSYEGGKHGEIHPISWYREYDGGRIFYTALGHTPETYQNPVFVLHLENAIKWLLN